MVVADTLPPALRGSSSHVCESCLSRWRLRHGEAGDAEIRACLGLPADDDELPEAASSQESGQ